MDTANASSYKKIRQCFRLDPDLVILIPELLRRMNSRDNISEFFRLAARERFERLAREYNARPPA
jgi:predicted ATPase